MADYTALDNAICEFLQQSDDQAVITEELIDMAGGKWRTVDARIQAMRKSGRIRWHGRSRKKHPPGVRAHGWEVIAAKLENTIQGAPVTEVVGPSEGDVIRQVDALMELRSKLAQPEPEGPTDEELFGLEELRDAWNAQADAMNTWDELGVDEIIWFAQQQALALYAHPTPQPIPVSERLPEAGEMNDENEVWVEEPAFDYPLSDTGDYDTEPGKWVLRRIIPIDTRNNRRWLPAHALPLPQEPPQ